MLYTIYKMLYTLFLSFFSGGGGLFITENFLDRCSVLHWVPKTSLDDGSLSSKVEGLCCMQAVVPTKSPPPVWPWRFKQSDIQSIGCPPTVTQRACHHSHRCYEPAEKSGFWDGTTWLSHGHPQSLTVKDCCVSTAPCHWLVPVEWSCHLISFEDHATYAL